MSMVKKSKNGSLTATERFDTFLGFGARSVFPAQTKELPIYADARDRLLGEPAGDGTKERRNDGREVLLRLLLLLQSEEESELVLLKKLI